MHRLINTVDELNEAIKAAYQANDDLVLRDAEGLTWAFGPAHYPHEPQGGWGAWVGYAGFPFLVLWWPGSVVLPIPTERPVSIETDVT